MKEYKIWCGIAFGGFAGAISRYGLSGFSITWGGFPLNILMINLLGAFLLAGFLEISLERLQLPAQVRTGVSTGFLGAFTTFSGLCAETFGINASQGAEMSAGYVMLSLAGGICAAWIGIAAGRALPRAGIPHE